MQQALRFNSLIRRAYHASSKLKAADVQTQKRAGDISDAFVSLGGGELKPLAPHYADLKGRLIAGKEEAITESWARLLKQLQNEVPIITTFGSGMVPEIRFEDLDNPSTQFKKSYASTGIAVVRNVISEQEISEIKRELMEYIKANPHTKAFPSDNPQVFELYWSKAQVLARGHPNMLKSQKFLMSFWHSNDPNAPISTEHPVSYADRLRMRLPGDAQFALGPHVDGGSVERWDERGYGLGGVYDAVWRGEWEFFDPWESSCRLPVISNLHQGVGACSMFRMSQGWLSMSHTGANEGTLLVNPLLSRATAYYLLRPFFSPKKPLEAFSSSVTNVATLENFEFLSIDNWKLDPTPTSWIQGATPGHGQELSPILHPHLDLNRTMAHVPRVNPGDYVAWHCDTIHSVDRVHQGTADSSVLYIPACPLTESNATCLLRQRENFLKGTPSPDFGGGEGESKHVGRIGVEEFEQMVEEGGRRAMGLMEWDDAANGLTGGQKEILNRANKVLGFYS